VFVRVVVVVRFAAAGPWRRRVRLPCGRFARRAAGLPTASMLRR